MIDSFFQLTLLVPALTLAGLFLAARRADLLRAIALVSGLTSLIAASILGYFVLPNGPGMHVLADRVWAPTINVHLKFGIDPLSFLMIWITAFTTLLAVMAAIRDVGPRTDKDGSHDARPIAAHFGFIFLIQLALYAFFTARDLVLIFVCYELVLIPMYLMILVWGGKQRVYASLKFLLFTLFGSLPMLLAVAAVGVITWQQFQVPIFDVDILIGAGFPVSAGRWLFTGFALAFLVKVPLWPLHTWLPDAHTEAPTSGSIILAGVLLKMGTYGLAALAIPLFPEAAHAFAVPLQVLAVAGIILGALASLAQTDAKRLIAYSSVSHMAVVVLGLFAFTREAWLGAILQMAAHAVSTGALFFFIGALYRRRHDRDLGAFGGLATLSPGLAAWAAVPVFSSTALPGTAGFAAELLVLYGTFLTRPLFAVLATLAVILSAAYMLKFYKAIAFGNPTTEFETCWDGARPDELIAMAACTVVLVVVGVAPWLTVYGWMNPVAARLLEVIG